MQHKSCCERSQQNIVTSAMGSKQPSAASRMNVRSRITVSTHTDRPA